LGGILAAEADGVRRNQARRRRGSAVARWIAREERNGWARGKGGGRSKPTEPLVRFDQWLVRQVGQAWQWEREVEGVFLTKKLKTEIEKKKRTFLEKGFSM
jgi:hypothetical protein